ncbi:hypothetical protein M408DRAFT_29203 [Serendipita vermifera MAFF 305830]|uniref:Uncharacterized protein n=1 Tax=Serendipita vermifera MAFF 305830 TaxID=933852 RepID=A0A0C2W607_SERVB|nr:hypothetical protein M408DRAFT_29203 [Serendipita vermifera MAFF 305830]
MLLGWASRWQLYCQALHNLKRSNTNLAATTFICETRFPASDQWRQQASLSLCW